MIKCPYCLRAMRPCNLRRHEDGHLRPLRMAGCTATEMAARLQALARTGITLGAIN